MIRRSTLITVVVLAALLAVAYYLQQTKSSTEEAEATPTEASPMLFSFNSEISGLRLEKVGEAVLELHKDETAGWSIMYPDEGAADTGAIESALSQLLSTREVSSLQGGPSLDEAGLNPPVYRLLVVFKDDTEERISVGDETPTASGYYVQVGNRGLFIANKYSLDPLLGFATKPPFMPTPTPGSGEKPAAEPNTVPTP